MKITHLIAKMIISIFREFNLTAALYGETDTHGMAGVVVRKSTYGTLKSTAGVQACVNEYNGLGKGIQFIKKEHFCCTQFE